MMSKRPPFPEKLYVPERSRKQIRKAMGRAVDLLAQDVQFGCRLLEQAPGFSGDSNRFAARHLYRMLLGSLDGVDHLLTNGCGDEARVLLRKAVEITSQLHYVAIRQSDYMLGTAFMLEMFEEVETDFGPVDKSIMQEAPPIFAETRRVLEKAKKRGPRGRARWYSIQDGPRTIRGLVEKTGQPILVQMWDDLSRSVHGSRVMESVEQRKPHLMRALEAGGLMFGPLRTSALSVWSEALPHADTLWVLGTLAMLIWEREAASQLFSFNRSTRIPRLAWFSRETAETVDLICILEKSQAT
jgi:hypothetical protein